MFSSIAICIPHLALTSWKVPCIVVVQLRVMFTVGEMRGSNNAAKVSPAVNMAYMHFPVNLTCLVVHDLQLKLIAVAHILVMYYK